VRVARGVAGRPGRDRGRFPRRDRPCRGRRGRRGAPPTHTQRPGVGVLRPGPRARRHLLRDRRAPPRRLAGRDREPHPAQRAAGRAPRGAAVRRHHRTAPGAQPGRALTTTLHASHGRGLVSTISALVRATHALPTLAVTAFFTAVALSAGLGAKTAVLAVAVVVGQASIGWANDYVDAWRDRAAERRDKPVAAAQISDRVVGACAGGALVADVPLSLALGWRPGAAHLAAVGWAWLYDLRLKETWASWLPLAVSVGLVPVIIATALPGSPLPQATLVAAGSCCG